MEVERAAAERGAAAESVVVKAAGGEGAAGNRHTTPGQGGRQHGAKLLSLTCRVPQLTETLDR